MQTSNVANSMKQALGWGPSGAALVSAGDKARDLQSWTEATKHYAAFLKLNPKNVAIWVQLGNCAKEAKRFALSLDAYNSAIALNENNADAFLQKGHLLKLMGRLSEGIACYCESLALQPQDNPAFTELMALNALPTNLAATNPLLTNAAGMKKGPIIYLDVTDLIDYLKVNVSLSGIQRVVSNLIIHAEEYSKLSDRPSVKIVLPDYHGSKVYMLNKNHLDGLIKMVTTGKTNRDSINHVLDLVVGSKSEIDLTADDTLVIAGAFWIYQRYDLLNALRQSGVRITVFIHDLIQVTDPQFVESAATTVFRRSLVDTLSVVSYVMTNSQFVANDVRKYLKTRMNFDLSVTPVTLATELGSTELDLKKVHKDYLDLALEDYVLCVGTIEIRKNHMYLINLWEKLIAEFSGPIPNLVLVGKWGWQVEELQQHLAKSDYLGARLYIFNGISDVDLIFLYKHCLFTIYPSFAEGWGLPVGESLGYGKPCVASNVTAIPEVGGAWCKYIDPFDVEDGYRVVSAVLEDRAGLTVWAEDIRINFKPKTWKAFSLEFFDVVFRHQQDKSLDVTGNNCVIETGSIASFGNDALVHLDIRQQPFISARMTRMSGWHGLEGWGCWASRRRATLRFKTRIAEGVNATVYLCLQAPEGDEFADCTIKVGDTATFVTGLGPMPRWVTAPGEVESSGMINMTLISGKGFNLRSNRGLYVGIVSLAIAVTSDIQMRLRTIEAIVPGGIASNFRLSNEAVYNQESLPAETC